MQQAPKTVDYYRLGRSFVSRRKWSYQDVRWKLSGRMKLGWMLTDHWPQFYYIRCWPLAVGRSEALATPDRNKRKCFLHMRVFSRKLFLYPFPVAISLCLVKEESDLRCPTRRNKYLHHAKGSQWNDNVVKVLPGVLPIKNCLQCPVTQSFSTNPVPIVSTLCT